MEDAEVLAMLRQRSFARGGEARREAWRTRQPAQSLLPALADEGAQALPVEAAAHEDAARQSAYEAPLRSTDSFRDVFAQAAQHPSRPKAPAQTTSLAGQVAADIATSLLVEPPVIRSGQLKRSSGE